MSVESKTTVHALSDGSTWVRYEVDFGYGTYRMQHRLFDLDRDLRMWWFEHE